MPYELLNDFSFKILGIPKIFERFHYWVEIEPGVQSPVRDKSLAMVTKNYAKAAQFWLVFLFCSKYFACDCSSWVLSFRHQTPSLSSHQVSESWIMGLKSALNCRVLHSTLPKDCCKQINYLGRDCQRRRITFWSHIQQGR